MKIQAQFIFLNLETYQCAGQCCCLHLTITVPLSMSKIVCGVTRSLVLYVCFVGRC